MKQITLKKKQKFAFYKYYISSYFEEITDWNSKQKTDEHKKTVKYQTYHRFHPQGSEAILPTELLWTAKIEIV